MALGKVLRPHQGRHLVSREMLPSIWSKSFPQSSSFSSLLSRGPWEERAGAVVIYAVRDKPLMEPPLPLAKYPNLESFHGEWRNPSKDGLFA